MKSQKKQNNVLDIDCDDGDSDGKNDEDNSDRNQKYKQITMNFKQNRRLL